jgi:hypothetical protein
MVTFSPYKAFSSGFLVAGVLILTLAEPLIFVCREGQPFADAKLFLQNPSQNLTFPGFWMILPWFREALGVVSGLTLTLETVLNAPLGTKTVCIATILLPEALTNP